MKVMKRCYICSYREKKITWYFPVSLSKGKFIDDVQIVLDLPTELGENSNMSGIVLFLREDLKLNWRNTLDLISPQLPDLNKALWHRTNAQMVELEGLTVLLDQDFVFEGVD